MYLAAFCMHRLGKRSPVAEPIAYREHQPLCHTLPPWLDELIAFTMVKQKELREFISHWQQDEKTRWFPKAAQQLYWWQFVGNLTYDSRLEPLVMPVDLHILPSRTSSEANL